MGANVTGARLLASLGLILLATAVLPSAAAWRVNRSRVRLAAHDIAGIAEALRHSEPKPRVVVSAATVLCGPGRLPLASAPAAERWVTMPRAELAAVVGDVTRCRRIHGATVEEMTARESFVCRSRGRFCVRSFHFIDVSAGRTSA